MKYLDQELIQYSKSDIYPFHMPGHKRKSLPFFDPYEIDITEIEGFDNLHHAEGIIKEAQNRAAELYGSKECYFLVNGSSCGILAAIRAACFKGGRILVGRNSHKAVYHGILEQELVADYIYPEESAVGIQGQLSVEEIAYLLKEAKEDKTRPMYQAVVITSPTYDGVVSDVKAIAELIHSYDIPLIVDEAHGAHFGFHEDFPENAVKQGADLVIMSLHKTLPSFTQTALLHKCSDRIDSDRIRHYLSIYETSSPSYIFMAGMEACNRYVKEEGDKAFASYSELLKDFYKKTEDLQGLHVLRKEDLSREEAFDFDFGKLVIISKDKDYSGVMLAKELLEKYGLQMEMAAGNYTLAMTSIMDSQEGFDRLNRALHEIDQKRSVSEIKIMDKHPYRKLETLMTLAEVWERKGKEMTFEEAIGRMSKDYVFLYPPGIPLVVPGEEISESLVEALNWCQKKGLTIEGIPREGWLNIVI